MAFDEPVLAGHSMDQVSASLWAKNVFNKYHVQNVISYNDIITQAVGQPATYGVTLKVRWN